MNQVRSVFVVDAHTTGTPIRVVTGGFPKLHGGPVSEKMEYMRTHCDYLRTFVMQQPRGFRSLVGAVLTEAGDAEADYGVFYIDALTYQPMCGAGTLSVAKVLAETGMVRRVEPETVIKLETPTGVVTVFVRFENGEVADISLENVPAFLYCKDLHINVPDLGDMSVDIGYGGNFFTIVDAASIGLNVDISNTDRMRELSRIILRSANDAIEIVHPENPAIDYMDQLLFCDDRPDENGEYLCQCIFGDAQADISPCGTGTSTRIAQRFFSGRLGLGETFRQKSVYGGVFCGRAVREAAVGDFPAVVPRVSCSDVRITGFNQLVAESSDRLKDGFVSW